MINDILDSSKLKNKKMELDLSVGSVKKEVYKVIHSLRHAKDVSSGNALIAEGVSLRDDIEISGIPHIKVCLCACCCGWERSLVRRGCLGYLRMVILIGTWEAWPRRIGSQSLASSVPPHSTLANIRIFCSRAPTRGRLASSAAKCAHDPVAIVHWIGV